MMSSCSIEINEGNLKFLAPTLRNTQTSILFLSHHSCLAIAPWGSSLAMHICLFLLCHPEGALCSSAVCLHAGGDMHSLRCSGLSPEESQSRCVHWVRSQKESGTTQTPSAQLLDGKLCPWGAEAGHLELLWAAAGQIRRRSSLLLSDSVLPPVSRWTAEMFSPYMEKKVM